MWFRLRLNRISEAACIMRCLNESRCEMLMKRPLGGPSIPSRDRWSRDGRSNHINRLVTWRPVTSRPSRPNPHSQLHSEKRTLLRKWPPVESIRRWWAIFIRRCRFGPPKSVAWSSGKKPLHARLDAYMQMNRTAEQCGKATTCSPLPMRFFVDLISFKMHFFSIFLKKNFVEKMASRVFPSFSTGRWRDWRRIPVVLKIRRVTHPHPGAHRPMAPAIPAVPGCTTRIKGSATDNPRWTAQRSTGLGCGNQWNGFSHPPTPRLAANHQPSSNSFRRRMQPDSSRNSSEL